MDAQESKEGWSDPAGSAKYQTPSAALRLLARIIARELGKSKGGEDKTSCRKTDDPPMSRDDL
jgi:hypothetical protein